MTDTQIKREKRKVALITGASGGLGEELCREFARNSFDLVITARSEEKLEVLATRLRRSYGVEVWVLPADLTRPEAPQALYSQIREMGLAVDVLVNNAGFGYAGYFIQNKPGLQERMIALNVLAPTRLCRLFIPEMLARGSGKVLNMASTASFVAGPMNSIYCAGKAYLLHLSEALSEEMEDSGVTITALCPGATQTGFARNANMETTRLFNFGVMDPAYVAHVGYQALMHGKRVQVAGHMNQFIITCTRLAPRIISTKVSRMLQVPFAIGKKQ